ncbi:MAG: alpha/beta hydrolase [Chloroflexota bacterium]
MRVFYPTRLLTRTLILLSSLFLLVPIQAQQNDFLQVACDFPLPFGVRLDCYTLRVPENRTDPDSNTVTLSIAVLRHPDGNPEADPILFLQGGPGGNTLDTLQGAYNSRFEPLFATNRDIILFDQRGVGRSTPALDCDVYQRATGNLLDYEIDGRDLSTEEVEALLDDLLLSCAELLSGLYDLSGYNSAESAADVDAIRSALGYEQINLWGISYGTRLALTVMRDYPDSINRVVLDSAYPLDANLFTDYPASFNRSLDTLFSACASDDACNETFPDLETVFYSTVDDLNRRPLRLDAPDAFSSRVYEDTVFTGDLLTEMVFRMFYVTNLIPRLPQLIYEASERDVTRWAALVGWLAPQRDTISIGMYYAVQCQEEVFFTEGDTAVADAWASFPLMASFAARSLTDADLALFCDTFSAGESSAIENMPVISDIPTLILAGEYDPITPPEWGQRVADRLPDSVYVGFPASGHGVSSSEDCAQSVVVDFLTRDDTAVDARCTRTLRLQFSGARRGDFDNPNSAGVISSGTLMAE